VVINRNVAVAPGAGFLLGAGLVLGAGLLLGVADFVWIKFVPFPFGGLGNSMAVWAVVAFLLTARARWGLGASVAGGAVLLVVAVPAYYLAAWLIQHDDLATVYASASLRWMAMAVLAGAVFGAGGHLARTPGRLRRAALALPGAVLFAEAAIEVRRIAEPDYGVAGPLGLAILLVLLGVVLSRRSLLLTVPLAALGFALFTATGFH
jgi:hypothetical protein